MENFDWHEKADILKEILEAGEENIIMKVKMDK